MIVTKDIVFIHIPKTAGRSIMYSYCKLKNIEYNKAGVSVGYEPLPLHSTASEVRRVMGEDYDKAFRFTIVRNPFDRLVSFYFYGNINFRYKFETFEDFVLYVCTNQYKPEADKSWWVAKVKQVEYINDDINAIIKYEEIDEFWKKFTRFELPIKNNTDHQHWSHYYDNELMQIVKTYFHEDFKQFYPCEL